MAKSTSAKRQVWLQIAKRTFFDLFSVATFNNVNTIEKTDRKRKAK